MQQLSRNKNNVKYNNNDSTPAKKNCNTENVSSDGINNEELMEVNDSNEDQQSAAIDLPARAAVVSTTKCKRDRKHTHMCYRFAYI